MSDQTGDQVANEQQPLGLEGAKKRKDQAAKARKVYESDWYLNLAFFQGEQWVAYDGRGLYKPKVRSRVTLTDNRVQPAVRTEVARLTKARPGWGATPSKLDSGAANDAQTSGRLLDRAWDHLSMATKRREALNWSRICGAGFVRTLWDDTVGEGVDVVIGPDSQPIPHPSRGGPLLAGEMPELEAMGAQTKRIGGGEVELTVRSPFDIFPDPLATSLEDARWIIDEAVQSPEWVKERFGKEVQPDAPPDVGIVESRFHSRGVDSASGEKLGVRVFELWERPSPTVPQGRHIVWCDSALLLDAPNEYGRIPYSMFAGIVVPGRFWPDAIVTQMRPVQARWNKAISQVAENMGRTANPVTLIDRLQMAGGTFSGVPGEQVWHTGGAQRPPVEFVQPPAMPGYTMNLLDILQSSMREISGRYEEGGSPVPAGVTAASAISLIQEQVNELLIPDVESVELTLADIGQQALELMVKNYTTDRIIVVAGEEGIVDVDTFKANASFQVPSVSVVPMSTFPRSLAARQAAIRDILNMFFQYAVPIDATALSRALKDMQVGGLEHLVQSYSADVNQAQREHVNFLRGAPIVVRIQDNDAVHIQEHEDFMKTPRYDALPPEEQMKMVAHVQTHRAQAMTKAPNPAVPTLQGSGMPAGPGTIPTEASGNPVAAEQGGAAPPPPA